MDFPITVHVSVQSMFKKMPPAAAPLVPNSDLHPSLPLFTPLSHVGDKR